MEAVQTALNDRQIDAEQVVDGGADIGHGGQRHRFQRRYLCFGAKR